MNLAYCHGNQYDIISTLKVLPNNRVANTFIVCLHYEISFFGIFHRFTNTLATKNLSSLLTVPLSHLGKKYTLKLIFVQCFTYRYIRGLGSGK